MLPLLANKDEYKQTMHGLMSIAGLLRGSDENNYENALKHMQTRAFQC